MFAKGRRIATDVACLDLFLVSFRLGFGLCVRILFAGLDLPWLCLL